LSGLSVIAEFLSRLGGKKVLVWVGPEFQGFPIHENLARAASGLIDTVCVSENDDFEMQKRIMLTDQAPEHFELFTMLLYHRKVFSM